jgi:hypothetical protein
MNKFYVVAAIAMWLTACASVESVPDRSYMDNQSIPVVPAVVENPYPQCKKVEGDKRTATLHVARNARVYLQEGELCQMAN